MAYTTAAKVAAIIKGAVEGDIDADWISFADSYIDTFCGIDFNKHTDVEEEKDIVNTHTDVLIMDGFPIISVSKLDDNGTEIAAADYEVYKDEGIIKLARDEYWCNFEGYGYFTKGRKTVTVTYTYGYESVPTDIEYCATVLAAQIARSALDLTTGAGDVVGETMGDYSIKYNPGASQAISITPSDQIITILNKYKSQHIRAVI